MKNSDISNRRAALPPELLSKYEPQKCFAHNAISETYLVKSLTDGKEYVAKIYDRFFLEEGTDERVILKRLNHPALPNLIESIETKEVVCVVRDYVKGVALDRLNIPLKERAMLGVGAQLCDILTYLHNQKPPIIHRDIKPSNVIINGANKVSLIDFDISREYDDNAVRDTTLVATDGFSPPEQYGFKQTDALADIYSFGCLMCWLLTGSNNASETDVIKNRALVNVLKKCTAFSPKDRYKTAKAVKAALYRACNRGANKTIAVEAIILAVIFAGGFALGRLTAPATVPVQEQTERTEDPLLREYTFKEPLIEESVKMTLTRQRQGGLNTTPVTYADLEKITKLYIWGNTPCFSGEWLYYDSMSDGGIRTLEDLRYMKNLKSLILMRQPNLSDVSPLSELPRLSKLAVFDTAVTDFSPLNNVHSLETLVLDNTGLLYAKDTDSVTAVYVEGLSMTVLGYGYEETDWVEFWEEESDFDNDGYETDGE